MRLLKDLYARILRNPKSTFLAILVLTGLSAWKKQIITTSDLLLFWGGIATVAGLLSKDTKKTE